jgi:hypothetical protein
MSMLTRPLSKADYDEIVQVIDRWWGGPTSALAHPIFFYELGRMARVVESDGLLVGFLLGFICPYASFEEDCQREGCKELKALTTLGNEASVRFHQALGWTMAEVEDYAGPGRMRIVFTRSLTNR